MDQSTPPIPVILVPSKDRDGHHVFNPNRWQGKSRGVIQSCASELSVLAHAEYRIQQLCQNRTEICRPYFETLLDQWTRAPWKRRDVAFLGQVPDLHIMLEGFLGGLKTLLDLTVELLNTEGVVAAAVHGFHRDGDVIGGRILNVLQNNAVAGKSGIANRIAALVGEHKGRWIDGVIDLRDHLLHPPHGVQQVMFGLEVVVEDATLRYRGAVTPRVGQQPLDAFAKQRLADVTEFCSSLLRALTEAA